VVFGVSRSFHDSLGGGCPAGRRAPRSSARSACRTCWQDRAPTIRASPCRSRFPATVCPAPPTSRPPCIVCGRPGISRWPPRRHGARGPDGRRSVAADAGWWTRRPRRSGGGQASL